MKSVRKPSVVPVYAVGAVWLVYTFLFGLHSIWQGILCTGISAAVYLMLKTKFPGVTVQVETPQAPPNTGNPQLDELISQGRDSLKKLRILNGKIPDAHITACLNEIQTTTTRILARLEEDNTQFRRCRQFLEYYLPTTVKLLERYVTLQNQNQHTDNIQEAMNQIETMLDKIRTAFQKQLDRLFQDDMVDITAEISVMEQILQTNGLTD